MNQGVVYCFTHDSIALGEDGPTHQPIGELMALRLIPNVTVIRPADANETSQAWLLALQNTKGPTVLALSRQALPHLAVPAGAVARGAYVIAEAGRPGSAATGGAEPSTQAPTNAELPDVILIASGSEVQLCLAARDVLEAEGVLTRVVSMPSMELFEQQPEEYRDAVLPPAVQARVTVEAGVTRGWHEYAGNAGERVGVNRFGASGPGPVVMREYGMSVENVVAKARKTLAHSA
jgi:transketolase